MSKSGIYTITCLVNNKMYVGMASDLYHRKCSHFSELKYNKHRVKDLQDDYNKYGKESFIYETLVKCKKRFLYSEEHYWCNMLNVHNPIYGYNNAPTNPYGKGKPRKAISTRVALLKMKKVIVLSIDNEYLGKFNGYKEATDYFNIPSNEVGIVCRGKRNQSHGMVFIPEEKYDSSINYTVKKIYFRKPILMYSKEREFIKEFESINEACKYMNVTQGSLWNALNRIDTTCKGYYWEYKNKEREKAKRASRNKTDRHLSKIRDNNNILNIKE